MKNSGKFQNSMRAVTINSEFSLPGLSPYAHAWIDMTIMSCVDYTRVCMLGSKLELFRELSFIANGHELVHIYALVL